MKKLSRTQWDTLEYAARKPDREKQRLVDFHFEQGAGWFYPQYTARGSIDFFCKWQTCVSLAKLGYLERRKDVYGTFYRITEAGRQRLTGKAL